MGGPVGQVEVHVASRRPRFDAARRQYGTLPVQRWAFRCRRAHLRRWVRLFQYICHGETNVVGCWQLGMPQDRRKLPRFAAVLLGGATGVAIGLSLHSLAPCLAQARP